MNILKRFLSAKKIAIFLMVAVTALTLVACGQTTKVPYGSLGNDPYLTVEGYTVTEKQLYDQLRTSSLTRLNQFIDEQVFKDVVLNTSNLSEFEVKAFEQEINTALFSSATITAKQISEFPESEIAKRILSYADSFVITNPSVSVDDVISYLQTVVADVIARATAEGFDEDLPFVFGYLNQAQHQTIVNTVIKQYTLPVLKKVYANQELGNEVGENLPGDINDKDSAAYISEAHAVTYFRNNIAGKYDTTALIIKFDSAKEQEIARFKHGIKSNARGEWFKLPNLGDQSVIDILNAGSSHAEWQDYHQAVVDILEDNLKLVQGSFEVIDYREAAYATYYNSYVINSTRDAGLLLNDFTDNNQLLDTFLAIYDELNGTTLSNDTRETLVEKLTLEYTSPLFTATPELRTQVYAMSTEVLYDNGDGVDKDNNPYAKPYSRQIQSISGNSYLIYVLEDGRAVDENVLNEENKDEIKFEENTEAQAILADIYSKLIEQRLNATYINSKVTEKYENVKIDIYDPIIRELYKNGASYKGSTGFKNDDVLATINGTDLTVDAYFELLESTLGLSTALDLIFMEKLNDSYGNKIEEKEEEFRKQLETQYVNPFLADQYASAGFPAKIGLENFLLLGFGAWARDGKSATQDAIDKVFVQQELRKLFQEDLRAHFPGDTPLENIYTKFADLANHLRDVEVSIGASHLLFQIDIDRDGKADDPTKLDAAELALYETYVLELTEIVNNRAKLEKTVEAGIQKVVDSYTNSTRYELTILDQPVRPVRADFATVEDYELAVDEYLADLEAYQNGYNKEDEWLKYRKAGIQLIYQDLGNISNQTNFPNAQSRLDEAFYEYAIKLANHIKDQVIDSTDGIPSKTEMENRAKAILPLYAPAAITTDNTIIVDGNSAVRSSFGWHLIIAKSYQHQESAMSSTLTNSQKNAYTSTVVNPFNAEEKLIGYNELDHELTWQQILIHIEESKTETGVITLPTNVNSAITKYFTPLMSNTMYNSSYVQLEIAFLYIFEGNVVISDNQDQNTRLQVLRNANFNQFFNYSYFEGYDGTGNTIYDQAHNEFYAESYGNFFSILNPEV
ncbi:hypothetical protein [Acholeplasma granularum]|uniref:hypothetical protein n=1 Tax=Acholeplasma granularum TaxID=264635 RepID=UPI000471A5FD|nr:hypothetical protein [Acholeplasma granularum]